MIATTIEAEDVLTTSKDAIWCDLNGDIIVLHLSSGVYFGLEGVAPDIWQFMQSPCTIADIVTHLTSRFDISEEACRTKTMEFLDALVQRELIVVRKTESLA